MRFTGIWLTLSELRLIATAILYANETRISPNETTNFFFIYFVFHINVCDNICCYFLMPLGSDILIEFISIERDVIESIPYASRLFVINYTTIHYYIIYVFFRPFISIPYYCTFWLWFEHTISIIIFFFTTQKAEESCDYSCKRMFMRLYPHRLTTMHNWKLQRFYFISHCEPSMG